MVTSKGKADKRKKEKKDKKEKEKQIIKKGLLV